MSNVVHVVWRAKHHGVKEPLMAFSEHDLAAAWMVEQPIAYPFRTLSGIDMHGRWNYGIDAIPARGFAERTME